MQIKGIGMPRSRSLEQGMPELSREARKRLSWFDYYDSHGRNVALTCRHFGISRQAFYRWKPRYDPKDLTTLEDRSHRLLRRRQPIWTAEQAERVRRLREQCPRWGKGKLAVLLRREGWRVSASMVGRILTSLRQGGVLKEPRVFRVKRRRDTAHRPWALRKPSDYAVNKLGDLVELDTMDLRPSSSSINPHPKERSPCVTNLLDDFTGLIPNATRMHSRLHVHVAIVSSLKVVSDRRETRN